MGVKTSADSWNMAIGFWWYFLVPKTGMIKIPPLLLYMRDKQAIQGKLFGVLVGGMERL